MQAWTCERQVAPQGHVPRPAGQRAGRRKVRHVIGRQPRVPPFTRRPSTSHSHAMHTPRRPNCRSPARWRLGPHSRSHPCMSCPPGPGHRRTRRTSRHALRDHHTGLYSTPCCCLSWSRPPLDPGARRPNITTPQYNHTTMSPRPNIPTPTNLLCYGLWLAEIPRRPRVRKSMLRQTTGAGEVQPVPLAPRGSRRWPGMHEHTDPRGGRA